MEAFFWLSSEVDKKHSKYRDGIVRLGTQIGMKPTFADKAPSDQSRLEWVSEKLTSSDFAFFDVTSATPDCLVALGMAIENDAQWFVLRNPDIKPSFQSLLTPTVRDYFKADEYYLRVRTIIEEVRGASTIQHRQLIERIKQKVAQHGLLPLKGIAQELGFRPDEIRPLVYSMVDEKVLIKVSDKRWAKYAVRA